jgi:hypothetical protein
MGRLGQGPCRGQVGAEAGRGGRAVAQATEYLPAFFAVDGHGPVRLPQTEMARRRLRVNMNITPETTTNRSLLR